MNRYQSAKFTETEQSDQNDPNEQLSNSPKHAEEENEEEVDDDYCDNSGADDVSSDEWSNSIHTDEYSEEDEFKPTGEDRRANYRATTSRDEQFSRSNEANDRPSMFREYSRDRRSRPTENREKDVNSRQVNSRQVNGVSQTLRMFTWSDNEETGEKEIKQPQAESRLKGGNVKMIEAVRYLKENDAVIQRLIGSSNEDYGYLVQKLTRKLPLLSCTYGRTKLNDGDEVRYAQLLFDNDLCLNTVFDESTELCDKKMFFMLKLQFVKRS